MVLIKLIMIMIYDIQFEGRKEKLAQSRKAKIPEREDLGTRILRFYLDFPFIVLRFILRQRLLMICSHAVFLHDNNQIFVFVFVFRMPPLAGVPGDFCITFDREMPVVLKEFRVMLLDFSLLSYATLHHHHHYDYYWC